MLHWGDGTGSGEAAAAVAGEADAGAFALALAKVSAGGGGAAACAAPRAMVDRIMPSETQTPDDSSAPFIWLHRAKTSFPLRYAMILKGKPCNFCKV